MKKIILALAILATQTVALAATPTCRYAQPGNLFQGSGQDPLSQAFSASNVLAPKSNKDAKVAR